MINVDITKTLQENLKNTNQTQIKLMLQALQNDNLPSHVRLQFIYNIHQYDNELSLKEYCTTLIELSILNNAQYHGQTLQQLLIQQSSEHLRPIPQIVMCKFQDIQIITNHSIQWDSIPLFDCLCELAQSYKLQPQEQQLFLQHYKYDKIEAQQFKLLVENNPKLVGEIIVKSHLQGINIVEYLEQLMQFKISLQTLEIVNHLSKSIKIPEEFLNMFIIKCFESCEELKVLEIKNKQQQQQSRQVRLVAAFIKNLIKLKTLDPKSMYAELQGFCLENQTIKEAVELFKLIKSSVEEQ